MLEGRDRASPIVLGLDVVTAYAATAIGAQVFALVLAFKGLLLGSRVKGASRLAVHSQPSPSNPVIPNQEYSIFLKFV